MRLRFRCRLIFAAPILAWAAAGAAQTVPTTAVKLPFTISKETTLFTEPLLPDGTPDYVAALNDKLSKGVTPETNALIPILQFRGTEKANILGGSPRDRTDADARIIEQFLQHAGMKPLPPGTQLFQNYSDYLTAHQKPQPQGNNFWVEVSQSVWTAADKPDVAAYLKSQDRFFDMAVEASERPYLYIPIVATGDRDLGWAVFSYAGLSQFGRAWCTRAMFRAGAGDMEGALADLAAIQRFSRLLAQHPNILSILLAAVYEGIATDGAAAIALSGKLNAAQCDAYGKGLEGALLPRLGNGDLTERCVQIQGFFIPIATGRLDLLPSTVTPQTRALLNSMEFSAVDWNVVLGLLNTQRDQEVAALNAPTIGELEERAAALKALYAQWNFELQNHQNSLVKGANESQADYSQRVAHALIAMRPSDAYVGSEKRRRETEVRASMLPVLLDAARVRAATGRWPQTAQDLASMKMLPHDPFARDASTLLRYRLINGMPQVASVGLDQQAETGDDIFLGAASPIRP